jgi:hypothetical protein
MIDLLIDVGVFAAKVAFAFGTFCLLVFAMRTPRERATKRWWE